MCCGSVDTAVVMHDGQRKRWLWFREPLKILTAHDLAEVMTALHAVEEAVVGNGLWAAGFVSYEAAPAFDSALVVRTNRDFPLLWFGLYRAPEEKPGKRSGRGHRK